MAKEAAKTAELPDADSSQSHEQFILFIDCLESSDIDCNSFKCSMRAISVFVVISRNALASGLGEKPWASALRLIVSSRGNTWLRDYKKSGSALFLCRYQPERASVRFR